MAEKSEIYAKNIEIILKDNQNNITNCLIYTVDEYNKNSTQYSERLVFDSQENQQNIVSFKPRNKEGKSSIQNDSNNLIVIEFFRGDISTDTKFIAINPNNTDNDKIVLEFDKNYKLTSNCKGVTALTLLNIEFKEKIALDSFENIYSNNFSIDNSDDKPILTVPVNIEINPFTNKHEIKFRYYDSINKTYLPQERTFELNVSNPSSTVNLIFNNNKFEAENATIKETTNYLNIECNLENVNAFMVNDKMFYIKNKKANFLPELNKNYEIKFGYYDEAKNEFLNSENQVVCEFSLDNFSEENILTVDTEGKCSLTKNGSDFTSDLKQKMVHNKRDTNLELGGGGVSGAGAVGFGIAIAFGLNPIAAAIIIAVLAVTCLGLLIHGGIKKSKIYTPLKEDKSQKPETKNSNKSNSIFDQNSNDSNLPSDKNENDQTQINSPKPNCEPASPTNTI